MSEVSNGTNRTPLYITSAIVVGVVIGYSLRLVQDTRKQQAKIHVDESWVSASRKCWTGLTALHDDAIAVNLSDPTKFRVTFPGYGTMNDRQILGIAQQSQTSAPAPDQGMFLGFRPASVPTKSVDYDALAKKWGGVKVESTAEMLCNLSDGVPSGFTAK
jgi:hypothetical protein